MTTYNAAVLRLRWEQPNFIAHVQYLQIINFEISLTICNQSVCVSCTVLVMIVPEFSQPSLLPTTAFTFPVVILPINLKHLTFYNMKCMFETVLNYSCTSMCWPTYWTTRLYTNMPPVYDKELTRSCRSPKLSSLSGFGVSGTTARGR